MNHWTLDDIPWDRFDLSRVDPETVRVVKAASLVEYNGDDYVIYLCNVFSDDPEFQEAARHWGTEEVQHGEALGRWAMLADPSWDFRAASDRFCVGYKLQLESSQSVRGSRAGELVARCVVEIGTSSFYSAIKDGCGEPALREVVRRIAGDEFRHYKLFYTHLKRYLERDGIGAWNRLRIAAARVRESEDDELAYAYYAANGGAAGYDRATFTRAYARGAFRFYRPQHIDKGVAMFFKAAGLDPQSRLRRLTSGLAWRFIDYRSRRLAAKAA